jgi:hypothetical protein
MIRPDAFLTYYLFSWPSANGIPVNEPLLYSFPPCSY